MVKLNNRTTFEFSVAKTKDSYRIVPITKVLLNDLKMLYDQCKKEYYNFNDDFFVISDARPIADSTIYDIRTKLAEAANLKAIRLHDFRHSCASLLINNGANVTLVAKFLGHTKIEETLNTYSHMFSIALDNVDCGRPVFASSRIISIDDNYITFWYQRHDDDKFVVEKIHIYDFIKRIIIHIKEKGFKTIRYYSFYSKHHKQEKNYTRILNKEQYLMQKQFTTWRMLSLSAFKEEPYEYKKCKGIMNLCFYFRPREVFF